MYVYTYTYIYIYIYIYMRERTLVGTPCLAYSTLKKVLPPAREYMF